MHDWFDCDEVRLTETEDGRGFTSGYTFNHWISDGERTDEISPPGWPERGLCRACGKRHPLARRKYYSHNLEFDDCNKKDGTPRKIVIVDGPVLDPQTFMDYPLRRSRQQGNVVVQGDFNNGPVNKSYVNIVANVVMNVLMVGVIGVVGWVALRAFHVM
jgi:hypothetical protein